MFRRILDWLMSDDAFVVVMIVIAGMLSMLPFVVVDLLR
jgi:energy-converting hydrogenase Eha subunit B